MSYRAIINILILLLFLCINPVQGFCDDIYIAFTANINAALQHCNCGENPRGGIDRLKSFLETFKNAHQNTIIIDGGDMMNSYPYLQLNRTVLQAMQQLPYDIMVPGDQEFIEDRSFTRSYLDQLKSKLLLTNSDLTARREGIFEFPGMRIAVMAVLSQDIFTYIPKPEILNFLRPDDKLTGPAERSDYRILVYHGRMQGLNNGLSEFKGRVADIVLLAHEQLEEATDIKGIKVVGLGRDAESVAVIHLSKQDGKVLADIDYRPINTELIADPAITEMIQKFKASEH